MKIKNELLLKKVEEISEEVMEIIGGGCDSDMIDKIPYFEYKSWLVTVPNKDETLSNDVDPIEYYGEENIAEYIEDAIRKDFI